jgi:hypothetical protein
MISCAVRLTSVLNRQSPRSAAEGEADQHGQSNPLVPPAPDGVAVAAADGVAVARLAVDPRTGVFTDGVVANEKDGACGEETVDEKGQQEVSQLKAGEVSRGKDAVVAGRSALPEVGECAQQVGDGATAGSEDGSNSEQLGSGKGGRTEGGAEQNEAGHSVVGYTGHGRSPDADSWLVGQPHDTAQEPPCYPALVRLRHSLTDYRTLQIAEKVKLSAIRVIDRRALGNLTWLLRAM